VPQPVSDPAEKSCQEARSEGARLQPCRNSQLDRLPKAPPRVRRSEGARLQPCHNSQLDRLPKNPPWARRSEGARLQPCHNSRLDRLPKNSPRARRSEGARLQPCHNSLPIIRALAPARGEGARLQPCHYRLQINPALAAEGSAPGSSSYRLPPAFSPGTTPWHFRSPCQFQPWHRAAGNRVISPWER
jgi:hypothetical protein